MSRRKARGARARPLAVPVIAAADSPGRSKRWWLVAGVAALLLIGVLVFVAQRSGFLQPSLASGSALPVTEQTAPLAGASYVGASSCKGCHEREYEAWDGSHHQLAMQAATEATVLGDFANARFERQGIASLFFRSADGHFMVRTDGPDGKLADYPISYTFGVYPLQQYLIAFPGGRYQALPIAWDSRLRAEGGQRWFHLNAQQQIDHRDPLHWTGIYHNWALQCAECHSTNLRKGYDAASNSYRTTFSEINVACESCHGPASVHLDWAGKARPPYAANGDKGLPSLNSGWREAWRFPTADARIAVRDRLADPAAMNTCAACHSRRATLSEERKTGAPLSDSHRLALLTAPNYHPDGQQREEVYVWASFLQSRMAQSGVTCMDCHEPHSQKRRFEGNALCTRCHRASDFDTPEHHRHVAGGKGAACVACHMPTQNYMVIHARPDHSLRVPRPDLSLAFGSPNACTQCHTERQADWAAAVMDQWYGKDWRDRPHFGATLHAAQKDGARALPGLLELAGSSAQPAIVRATAATLAQPHAHAGTLPVTRLLLQDADPLLRIAALGMLLPADSPVRILGAAPLLSDPVRGVRIEAAIVLADVADDLLPGERQAARQAALREYEAALALDADWPSVSVNLGNLRLRQGRVDEAIAAFQRAITLDAAFAAAYVNLADALRQQPAGDVQAEQVLRRGVATLPRDADLQHALGLLLTRKGERAEALRAISEAARLDPDNARYAYVEAIALHAAGQRGAALARLRSANRQHPNDLEILSALISIHREAGDRELALQYARKAVELLPDDRQVKRLLSELEGR